MPFATVDDVQLCYEALGDPAGPPVLLVAGLGVQLIDWPDYFVDPFLEAGYYIVRYDNRDIGHSTAFDGAPSSAQSVIEAMLGGQEPEVAYTLADMAADAVGLLDALGIDSAHVVGSSMGGMIAQCLAIAYPNRVRSLTSMMSTTGGGGVGQPSPEAMTALLTPLPADDRESRIAHGVEASKIWASPDHLDIGFLRKAYEQSWDRVGGPQAEHVARQLCAIVASPSRDQQLAGLAMPALVVHGTADPLVDPSGGRHTAACIPGAELVMVEGMGHDLPAGLIGQIFEPLRRHLSTTEAQRQEALHGTT